jgi:hypothetical protein
MLCAGMHLQTKREGCVLEGEAVQTISVQLSLVAYCGDHLIPAGTQENASRMRCSLDDYAHHCTCWSSSTSPLHLPMFIINAPEAHRVSAPLDRHQELG